MRIQRQVLILALASIATATLVSFVILSLLRGDRSATEVTKLSQVFNGHMEAASVNYAKSKAGEAVDMEKDVVSHLTSAHAILKNIYEGQPTEAGEFAKPDSDGEKEKVKLAIVSIEKLIEETKAASDKVVDQFGVAVSNGKSVLEIYADASASKVKLMRSVAWLAIGVIIVFCLGLIVLIFKRTREYEKTITASKQGIEKEEKRVNQLSQFIEGMANGNYDMQIETDGNDDLSQTLINMRDKLRNNAIEEQRRNWSTTGLAKIGEILRGTGNSAELYDNIIKFVVKYTTSNQGGLFILDDADAQNVYLELVACYAFERKKFLTKKIEVGQGLVGQCFLEKERIHLTEIPDDYVRITSGLGGERPTSCLLMPLKVNEKVFGVIELASFQLYPDHVVELVAKFAESIASTIANVKQNESTRVLLEQTQQQAEEMKSQEEEMRQNMEELSATQEEMHRKEREYINRIKELESQVGVAEKV